MSHRHVSGGDISEQCRQEISARQSKGSVLEITTEAVVMKSNWS